MTTDKITQNMEVIGADGVHVGTVDGVANGRIRLAKPDSGEGRHKGHAHFIDLGLVADVGAQGSPLCERGGGRDVRGRAVGKARLTKDGPMTVTLRNASRGPRQGLKPLRRAAQAAKETPMKLSRTVGLACRRLAPKAPATTHT